MDPPTGAGVSTTAIIWTQVFISGCGIMLNVIFLWRATKKKGRQKTLDSTLLFASIIKIVLGIEVTLRAFVILYAQKMYPDFYKYLDPVDLFMDGMYLWNLLIRNAFRGLVLKNIELPQNTISTSRKIKMSLLISTTVVLFFSLGYGIMLSLPRGHVKVYIDVSIYSLNVVVKQFPFVLITVLSILMSGKLGYVLYKKRRTVHTQISSTDSVGKNETLKQSLLVLAFQLVFFVAPACFVYSVELVEMTFEVNNYVDDITKEMYWMMRCILDVFNPMVFGPQKFGNFKCNFKGRQNPGIEIQGTYDQRITSLKQNRELGRKMIKDATQSNHVISTKKKKSLEALKIFTIENSTLQSPRQSWHSIQSLKSPFPYSPISLNSYQLSLKIENDTKKISFLNMADSDNDVSMYSPTLILNKIYTKGNPIGVGSACASPTSLFSFCPAASVPGEK